VVRLIVHRALTWAGQHQHGSQGEIGIVANIIQGCVFMRWTKLLQQFPKGKAFVRYVLGNPVGINYTSRQFDLESPQNAKLSRETMSNENDVPEVEGLRGLRCISIVFHGIISSLILRRSAKSSMQNILEEKWRVSRVVHKWSKWIGTYSSSWIPWRWSGALLKLATFLKKCPSCLKWPPQSV